jgi:hypothetical protein
LSKTTSLDDPWDPPFIANTIAPMLATAMKAAAMSNGFLPPPPDSRGGGSGIPAGVGKDTLPAAGVYP